MTPEISKSLTTCFVISGDFITKHVRELVEENASQEALSLLVDNLEGMTWDIAISICKGEKKLTGQNSDVGLEDEDPEVKKEWESHLRWMYAGTVRLRGSENKNCYMRPYARVTSWGKQD